jgi:hypothetical protein
LRKVQVKGRKHEFMIYELLGIKGSGDPELEIRERDARLNEMTWEAARSFERGDVAEAMRRYQAMLDVFPDDPVAKSMLKEGKS